MKNITVSDKRSYIKWLVVNKNIISDKSFYFMQYMAYNDNLLENVEFSKHLKNKGRTLTLFLDIASEDSVSYTYEERGDWFEIQNDLDIMEELYKHEMGEKLNLVLVYEGVAKCKLYNSVLEANANNSSLVAPWDMKNREKYKFGVDFDTISINIKSLAEINIPKDAVLENKSMVHDVLRESFKQIINDKIDILLDNKDEVKLKECVELLNNIDYYLDDGNEIRYGVYNKLPTNE